tara:strand:+ start:70003 stop:70419 length:417 start_codon:yes stop_codon:yes gene_type:complete
MANYYIYKSSLGSVAAYQVSGTPQLKTDAPLAMPLVGDADVTSIDFNSVTNWIQITNNSLADVRIGFSANGTKPATAVANYFIVPSFTQTPKLPLKVRQIWTTSDTTILAKTISVVASLTSISSGSIESNWSGSVGVG